MAPFRWMYGDAKTGGLATLNPMRWSDFSDASTIAGQIEEACAKTKERPINVEDHDVRVWPTFPAEHAVVRLRMSTKSVEEYRAWGLDRAKQQFAPFHQQVLKMLEADKDRELLLHYGNRPEAFYLKFLEFAEIHPNTDDPQKDALKMCLNYCKFMHLHRGKGHLTDLGAEMIRPSMQKGFIRMLSSRDEQGRRILLTFPEGMDEKVPEKDRARLYLYWFLKLMTLEDAMAPGWTIVHDMTGVTLDKVKSKVMSSNEAKEMIVDATFPWILSRILFVNTPGWMATSFALLEPFFPKSVGHAVDRMGDVTDPKNKALLRKYIDLRALPAGAPYQGGLEEPWDAALSPGLGVFYEPEMDPAENNLGIQPVAPGAAAAVPGKDDGMIHFGCGYGSASGGYF